MAIQFGSVPQNFDGVFNRPFLSAFTAHQLCRIYLPRATTSAQSTVRLRIYKFIDDIDIRSLDLGSSGQVSRPGQTVKRAASGPSVVASLGSSRGCKQGEDVIIMASSSGHPHHVIIITRLTINHHFVIIMIKKDYYCCRVSSHQ